MARGRAGGGAGVGSRGRPLPKGRAVDPQALAEVRAIAGELPRRRDLLIEHLHRIQDTLGCLPAPHLAALAEELRLSQAEVYEVASFYHHFDIVKDGEGPPASLTIRVCDSISCALGGAEALKRTLQERLGREVRVVGASCLGRCDRAPAALVGRHVVDHATPAAVEHARDNARWNKWRPSWRRRVCAAWAAPASRPRPSGSSCGTSRLRASWC